MQDNETETEVDFENIDESSNSLDEQFEQNIYSLRELISILANNSIGKMFLKAHRF